MNWRIRVTGNCRLSPLLISMRAVCLLFLLQSMAPVFAHEIGCGLAVIPEKQIKRGCGCGYHLQTDSGLQTFLQLGLKGENPVVFTDGKLQGVQAAPENAAHNYYRQGDEFSEIYSFADTRLQFMNRVTSSCRLGVEGCSVIVFESVLTVTASACSLEVTNVVGDCGC